MEIFGVFIVNQNSGMAIPLELDKENIIGRGIPTPEITKGRIFLPHPSVSKLHAKITLSQENHTWNITDHSKHGIRINHKRIKQQSRLKHGDKIEIGPFQLMFYEKFKSDDETSEAPLPVIEKPHSKIKKYFFNIFIVSLIEAILALTFPKTLIGMSSIVMAFAFSMVFKPEWKKKLLISYSFLMVLILLSCFGIFLSIYVIFFWKSPSFTF